MEQAYKHTDVFMTHTWRQDLHNRDNHARVKKINEHLNQCGFSTWFDSQRMEGKIRDKMAEGVDFTRCVLVFVTEEYMKKLDSGDDNDNCLYEFKRAMEQKTARNILCIVMEEKYENPGFWFGKLKNELGDSLFVSMAGDLNNDLYLKQKLDEVIDQLQAKGVTPSQRKKRCLNCTITDKDNKSHPLFSDGEYCTFCASKLLHTIEPKNYCPECNVHTNGHYCTTCKLHLLDENKKIAEIEEAYLQHVSLRNDIGVGKMRAVKLEQEVESIQQLLIDLENKRSEAKTSGKKLQLKDTNYRKELNAVRKSLIKEIESNSNLRSSALEFSKLQPFYDEELHNLEIEMQNLAAKRKEITQRSVQISQEFHACSDNLQNINSRILELNYLAIEEEEVDVLNEMQSKLSDATHELSDRQLQIHNLEQEIDRLKKFEEQCGAQNDTVKRLEAENATLLEIMIKSGNTEETKDIIVKFTELKNDNLRLKEENGALIRVISKLSRTPAMP